MTRSSEMEDINAEFGQADVAIIPGANDVVQPAAAHQGQPIYGMHAHPKHARPDSDRQQASDGRRLCEPGQRTLLLDKTQAMVFG